MLKRTFLLIIVLSLVIGASLSAQYAPPENSYTPPLRERILYGGNFSLTLGTFTYVDISPVVGLWLLPRLAVAAGPSYKFLKDPSGSTDAYGGKSFVRFNLIQELDKIIPVGFRMAIYAHCEYERMSYRSDFFYTNFENTRFSQDFVLAGFGISQYMGFKSSANFSLLWVLNESEIQIYDSPEFRIGFTF